MGDRIFRWYVEGGLWVRDEAGGTHRADADYEPTSVHLSARKAPVGSSRATTIDITADGVSIFDATGRPALAGSQADKVWTTIPVNTIREGAVLRLNIVSVAETFPGEDLTVELVGG